MGYDIFGHYHRPKRRGRGPSNRRTAFCDRVTNRRCAYCGIALEVHEVTMDHVVPVSKGGSNRSENLVIACGPCNGRKGSALIGEMAITDAKRLKGIILACLRTGQGLDGARETIEARGYQIGDLIWEELCDRAMRLCVPLASPPPAR